MAFKPNGTNLAELDALLRDLSDQHSQLSREYAVIVDDVRRGEISETISSIDYQSALLEGRRKLEEQRQALMANRPVRAMGSDST